MSVAERVVNDLRRTIFLNPGDPRAAALARAGGNFNPGSLGLWNALLALGFDWELAVDIGANYGEMLAGSRVRPASRVVAVEPNPVIAPLLKRTCAELPFEVEVVEKVLSHSEAHGLAFAIDTKWSGTSHIVTGAEALDSERFEVVDVPSTTLDALFPAGARTAVIKIDVEGAEPLVFQGAEAFFSASARVAVMLEVFHMPVEDLWQLQKERPFYLWNLQTQKLVALDVGSANELGTLLHGGEYYRQDALMLAGHDVREFDAELRARFGTTREVADGRSAERERQAREGARHLAALQADLEDRDRTIAQLQDDIAEVERDLVHRDAELAERDELIVRLEQTASDLRQMTEHRERNLEMLEKRLEEYGRSRAHRLAALYVRTGRAVRRSFGA